MTNVTVRTVSATPGAPDTSVQFNDAGSFAGNAEMIWDNVYDRLVLRAPPGGGEFAAGVLTGVMDTAENCFGLNIFGGEPIPASGEPGGNVYVYGGGGDSGTGGVGGIVQMQGGSGAVADNGGNANIIAGNGGTSGGAGGSVTIRAGTGYGSANGGDTKFYPGLAGGSGTNGNVSIVDPATTVQAKFDTSILTTDHLFSFPDQAGLLALMSVKNGGYFDATLSNATTAAIDDVLIIGHNSSGTAANGFGARQLVTLDTSTTDDTSAAAIDVSWTDATHASRKARLVAKVFDTAERSGLTIEADGAAADVYFEGGAGSGLPYGSCWGNEIAWQQTNAAQNTWYKISDTDMTDGQLNLVAHDGSGKLTVTKAGRYLINYSVTLECSALNKHVQTGISVNGTVGNDGIQHYEVATPNAELTIASTAIISLAASGYIEIAVRTTDTGTPNLLVDHLNISILQVGG